MLDKWMMRVLLPLAALGLLGFGALSGYHQGPRTWQDAAAAAVCVALSIAWGAVMGLQIHEAVRSDLMTWAFGTEQALAEEEAAHDALIGLLRENVSSQHSLQAAVQQHLLDLDAPDDAADSTQEEH